MSLQNINRLIEKPVKICSYVQLVAQSIKPCRYVYSQLSPHSVCHRCSAREANRQPNWRRHQSTVCPTQKSSASAHVLPFLPPNKVSLWTWSQASDQQVPERDLSISPHSPEPQLSSLVQSLLVWAMGSRDSLSYVSSLSQIFYVLKRPRLILLYLYFHYCFVLNASQWDNHVLWEVASVCPYMGFDSASWRLFNKM